MCQIHRLLGLEAFCLPELSSEDRKHAESSKDWLLYWYSQYQNDHNAMTEWNPNPIFIGAEAILTSRILRSFGLL
jgi:hypothetical protein